MQARGKLLELAAKNPAIAMLRPQRPGRRAAVSARKSTVRERGVIGPVESPISSNSLAAGWGSSYINQLYRPGTE